MLCGCRGTTNNLGCMLHRLGQLRSRLNLRHKLFAEVVDEERQQPIVDLFERLLVEAVETALAIFANINE